MSPVTSAVGVRSVLIATDFSQASEKPLRHALAIAHHYGAKFYVAHVISSLGFMMAGPEAITAAEEAVSRDAARLEDDLIRSGALGGLQYHFVVSQGLVWAELEATIREENIDLVVIGTHARHGMGKLLLGSVAEKIFRHADCMVLTVGPGSYEDSRVDIPRGNRTFLFATDFGEASLHALPAAISSANEFGARLVLLNVVPAIGPPERDAWCTATDVVQMREAARRTALSRLAALTRNGALDVEPEFIVEAGTATPVSEQILDTAERVKAEVIIMGLHHSKYVETVSHMPWATAYDVVCGAACPVLTVRT